MIIGIDVGGTFTDVVAADTDGKVTIGKVPSIPHDEGQAVLNGIKSLHISPEDVERLVHGTTVGTNAVIQRQGSKIAFITTYGFKDILEIGKSKRMIPGTMFKPFFVRPKPVVPRSRCFEIKERTLYDGQIFRPVDNDDVRGVCQSIKDEGVEAVAICFLHSYANPSNEEEVASIIRGVLGDIPISISSKVVPEYREFERYSTTVLNAYIQPLVQNYLFGLHKTLADSGYTLGVLTIASSGGFMTLDTAVDFPVQSILSGPAGGVVQCNYISERLGFENVITYDMGGTSTDVCLIKSYTPVVATDNLVGGFPLKIPQIDINTVGAGGGSIAWTDLDGALQVGPNSAGASPGPACYDKGGTEPTVTDANLILNRGNPNKLLGGSIRMKPELARNAFKPLMGKFPQLSIEQLAEGVLRLAGARMAGAIREVSVQRGHDPREFVLIGFGGAGPMHAVQVADELSIKKVLIPMFPGNLSAMGLVNCDLKHDYVKTKITVFSNLTDEEIGSDLTELQVRASAQLEKEGFSKDVMLFKHALEIRYWGQAFELMVPVENSNPKLTEVIRDFHDLHYKTYGHSDPGAELELVNLRLAAFGMVEKAEMSEIDSPSKSLDEAFMERRQVFFNGEFLDTPVYEREKLPMPTSFEGPAIIEEFGATTVVYPTWHVTCDTYGNLIFDKKE